MHGAADAVRLDQPAVAEAFGVRHDTVRLLAQRISGRRRRSTDRERGTRPAPVKSETALRMVTPLLEEPVADRAQLDDPSPTRRDRGA